MKKSSDSKFRWLALKMIPNLGNTTYKRLLDRFGDPANVFAAKLNDLIEVEGVRVETARRIVSKAWEGNPEDELVGLQKSGAKLITISDSSYPKELREIHDPPPLLYLKGSDIPHSRTMVSVVGSRNPSHYGLKITEEICQGLAIRNIAVVSGMARGIDSAAHWGCLRGHGFTVAVLGSGIDIIYPESNSKLFNNIVEKGTVITEFPLGTPPEAKNFPIRNRIISGLSKGVVVVEASKRSGSLITASLALEQGREVLAVPGSIESFKSTGTHLLIKQGAKLVENADDILEELGLNYPYSQEITGSKKMALPPLEEDEKTIYDTLGDYPIHIDQIVRYSKMDASRVAGLLTGLELKGVIKQLPGKMFVR
ncbi:MAG: DNA-processing protein DprA [Deltaproteobacteria bacterium]|nr:MAG: DNA-processing protein DprA [Deltaproteobacteria bacterium]